MKPLVLVTLIATLLTACGGQPPTATQPDQVEVTRLVEVEVTRLVETEVEVTRLVETVVTATPLPATPPPPTAEIDPTAYLATANITPDDLPQGNPGLVVIAEGPPNAFGTVPVVVRNNTDAPAWNLKISATARDDAGNILGTGSAILLTPTFAAPGGVVFGTVGFMDTSLESATIEYLVTADTAPATILARRDLEVLEHNIVGKNIVGTLLNSNASPLNLIQATVICFDDNLVPVVAPSSFTDQERVDAAAELPFSVNLFNDAAKCGRYFLAANGFETD